MALFSRTFLCGMIALLACVICRTEGSINSQISTESVSTMSRHQRSLMMDDMAEMEETEENGSEEEVADDKVEAKVADDEAAKSLDDVTNEEMTEAIAWTEQMEKTSCPIDLMDMSEAEMKKFLDDLVTPCSIDNTTVPTPETEQEFCAMCVRPLQTFLAREFHLADISRTEEEDWDPSNKLVHEKCALDATTYLQSVGMPYGTPFHEAVLKCANFKDDPTCTIATEDLIDMPEMKEALEMCQLHGHSDPEVLKSMGSSNATSDAPEEHKFCTECYWPFFEAMIQTTMSDEFLCKVKNDDNMTSAELEAEILKDPHMFACLLNVEGHLRENNMNSASIGYTEMEGICFNEVNHPDPTSETPIARQWILHEDMKEKLTDLECA